MQADDYLKTLKDRGKDSHIYKRFQHTGLEIAELLNDPKHKALYIKLAKQYDQDTLLGIAKDVSTRKTIENKGGYFMKIIQNSKIKNQNYNLKSKKFTTDKNENIDNK